MKNFFIIAAFFILSGCNSPTQTSLKKDSHNTTDTLKPDGTLTDTNDSKQPYKIKSSKKIGIYKGLYVFGNEVNTVHDCSNQKQVYWVEDESKRLSQAYKKATSFLPYPYESIYIEVKGYLIGKSKIGYAAEYENVLVVTDLVSSSPKSYKTDCFNFEFICLGAEPFWSLEINPDEDIIAFKDVGIEKTYVFPYKAAKAVGKAFIYDISNDKKESIKVSITKENCSDGMSDREYNYSAQVTINGKSLKGCAIKKGDK